MVAALTVAVEFAVVVVVVAAGGEAGKAGRGLRACTPCELVFSEDDRRAGWGEPVVRASRGGEPSRTLKEAGAFTEVGAVRPGAVCATPVGRAASCFA